MFCVLHNILHNEIFTTLIVIVCHLFLTFQINIPTHANIENLWPTPSACIIKIHHDTINYDVSNSFTFSRIKSYNKLVKWPHKDHVIIWPHQTFVMKNLKRWRRKSLVVIHLSLFGVCLLHPGNHFVFVKYNYKNVLASSFSTTTTTTTNSHDDDDE